jgi:hypothetical protein
MAKWIVPSKIARVLLVSGAVLLLELTLSQKGWAQG